MGGGIELIINKIEDRRKRKDPYTELLQNHVRWKTYVCSVLYMMIRMDDDFYYLRYIYNVIYAVVTTTVV